MDETLKTSAPVLTERMAHFMSKTTMFNGKVKTWSGRKKPKAPEKPANPFDDEHPELPKLKGKRRAPVMAEATEAMKPHRQLYNDFTFVCTECDRKYTNWEEHRKPFKNDIDDGKRCSRPAELMVECKQCTYPDGSPTMFNPMTSTHAYEHRVARNFPGENLKWKIKCPFCRRLQSDYISHKCTNSEFYGNIDDCYYWTVEPKTKKKKGSRM